MEGVFDISTLMPLSHLVPQELREITNAEIRLNLENRGLDLTIKPKDQGLTFAPPPPPKFIDNSVGVYYIINACEHIERKRIKTLRRILEENNIPIWLVKHNKPIKSIYASELDEIDKNSSLTKWVPSIFKVTSKMWDTEFVDKHNDCFNASLMVGVRFKKKVESQFQVEIGRAKPAGRPKKQDIVLKYIYEMFGDEAQKMNSKEIQMAIFSHPAAISALGGEVNLSTVRRAMGRKK